MNRFRYLKNTGNRLALWDGAYDTVVLPLHPDYADPILGDLVDIDPNTGTLRRYTGQTGSDGWVVYPYGIIIGEPVNESPFRGEYHRRATVALLGEGSQLLAYVITDYGYENDPDIKIGSFVGFVFNRTLKLWGIQPVLDLADSRTTPLPPPFRLIRKFSTPKDLDGWVVLFRKG